MSLRNSTRHVGSEASGSRGAPSGRTQSRTVMLSYLIRRSGSALVLITVVSFVAFALVFAAGDPAVRIAGEAGTAADAERVRAAYRFDRPLPLQYVAWLGALLHGNLGHSFYFDQPVTNILIGRLGTTMLLGSLAITFALVLAIP